MEQLLQLLRLSQFQLGNLSIIEIRQIISNLANNDVDFSGKNKIVVIKKL